MRKILIFGTGGHAKVILDIISNEQKYEIAGFIDNELDEGQEILNHKVLGADKDLISLIKKNSIFGGVIAVGNNYSRENISQKINNLCKDFNFINCIHSQAQIAMDVSIGVGNVLMAGSVINTSTSIGNHCIVNTNSSLDHDNTILDFSSIAPNSATGGNVKIGKLSALGIGSTILPGISVGPNSIIGAGSLVLEDIPSDSIYFGSPAKFIRKNLID